MEENFLSVQVKIFHFLANFWKMLATVFICIAMMAVFFKKNVFLIIEFIICCLVFSLFWNITKNERQKRKNFINRMLHHLKNNNMYTIIILEILIIFELLSGNSYSVHILILWKLSQIVIKIWSVLFNELTVSQDICSRFTIYLVESRPEQRYR